MVVVCYDLIGEQCEPFPSLIDRLRFVTARPHARLPLGLRGYKIRKQYRKEGSNSDEIEVKNEMMKMMKCSRRTTY